MSSDYIFDSKEDQRELERLRVIESVCDGATQRRLNATGLAPGWSWQEAGWCWKSPTSQRREP